MNTPVIVRARTEQDLDAIVAVEAESFHRPTSREWYVNELARPDVCFIYALRMPADAPAGATRDDVAGFCAFWRVADQIHINNIAVRPRFRGRGFGRLLLDHVLAEAARLDVPAVTLEVRRSNTVALGLYETTGFRVEGVRPAYYTHPVEDALVLWRGAPGGAGDS